MDVLGRDGKTHRLDDRNPPHVYRDGEDNGVATQTEETLWSEIKSLRGEREEMRRLLSELVDPDPCWFDHHGSCQAHDLQNPCPHEQAKKLLAEQNTGEGERTS